MSILTLSHNQIIQLLQDHREALTQFLMNRIRCPETAQDLCQETYLRLLRGTIIVIGLFHTHDWIVKRHMAGIQRRNDKLCDADGRASPY
ncbi:MAG: sigma factor [Methylobacter sp.]|nr:sigma factor [Methylobacter sp.]